MADYADPENTIVMDTTQGRVVIAMRPDLAPKHVEQIKALVREGFYDGIVFHRVIEGFMAQTGDPTGTGTGSSDRPDLPALRAYYTELTKRPAFRQHVMISCEALRARCPTP